MRGLGSLFAYVCIATLLAQICGLFLLIGSGRIQKTDVSYAIGIMTGVEKIPDSTLQASTTVEPEIVQPSVEQIASQRAIISRDIELREAELRRMLERLKIQRINLERDERTHTRIKEAFEAELKKIREGVIADGTENVRLVLENIRAKQAKEELVQMIEKKEINEVVLLLSAMPATKRAKIFTEFKTREEIEHMDEILRLMRKGVPEVNVVEKTELNLKEADKEGE
jgi:hypothetical protein